MHSRTSLALALAIMALSAWGTLSALSWPWKAKLFPLVIGIPLFFLALAEVLWVIFGKQDSGSIHAPTVGDVSRRAQFGKLRGGLRKTPEAGPSGAGATGGLESA